MDDLHKLSPEEAAVLALLHQRLQDAPAGPVKRSRAKKAAAHAAA